MQEERDVEAIGALFEELAVRTIPTETNHLAASAAGSVELVLSVPLTLSVPLQSSDPGPLPDWLVTFVTVTDALSALVGLIVAYLAYRGFQSGEHRSVRVFALGFALVVGGPLAIQFGGPIGHQLGGSAVPPLRRTTAAVLQQLAQFGGLLAIGYGLSPPGSPRQSGDDRAG